MQMGKDSSVSVICIALGNGTDRTTFFEVSYMWVEIKFVFSEILPSEL